MKARLACLTLLFLTTANTVAEETVDRDQNREHRRPPPAAFEACATAIQGDRCSFAGRNEERVEGSCEAPADKPLACRPDRAPRHDMLNSER